MKVIIDRNQISTPNLIKAMIAVNIVMYLISLVYSGRDLVFSLNPLYALTPSTKALLLLGASGSYPIAELGNWWSVITANWLHGSLLHIIFNMLALKTLTPPITEAFGQSRMFSIYTLSGACGFALSFVGGVSLTIGASAGICGLIGSALYFGKTASSPWAGNIYRQAKSWIVMLILIGFIFPNINNWGHAGGLLSGIAAGWAFGHMNQRQENFFDHILAASFVILTLVLLVFKSLYPLMN